MAARRRDEERWVQKLRSAGVVCAHPDDGWVDRSRNVVQFVYPEFQSKSLETGDVVALGWPRQYRLVTLTERLVEGVFQTTKWRFKEISN